MDLVTSPAATYLFRYTEKVKGMKDSAMSMWPEIPPEAMVFFAGEVLASGVVLWALINATGLDAMRWPGDLPVILGLRVNTGNEAKIGWVLNEIAMAADLKEAEVDQMKQVFLDMLQWLVVEQLHTSLFTVQRQELATILAQNNFDAKEREKILHEISAFLKKTHIDNLTAKDFFEKALKQSLWEALAAFEEKMSPENKANIAKMIG